MLTKIDKVINKLGQMQYNQREDIKGLFYDNYEDNPHTMNKLLIAYIQAYYNRCGAYMDMTLPEYIAILNHRCMFEDYPKTNKYLVKKYGFISTGDKKRTYIDDDDIKQVKIARAMNCGK